MKLPPNSIDFISPNSVSAWIEVKLFLQSWHYNWKIKVFQFIRKFATKKEAIPSKTLTYSVLFAMTMHINGISYLWLLMEGKKIFLYFHCFWSELLHKEKNTFRLLSIHWRFKSSPDILHLELPWITPSGFTIGITTIWYLSLKNLLYGL